MNQVDEIELDPNDPWEILFSQLNLAEELGHGAFGQVWKGILTKKDREKGKNKKSRVAVKMLRGKLVTIKIHKSQMILIRPDTYNRRGNFRGES